MREHPIVAIACSVLKPELTALAEWGLIDFPVRYIDSAYHMRPEALHDHLQEVIQQERQSGYRILVIYGDCSAHMGAVTSGDDIVRVTGVNCGELLLGKQRYKTLVKDGAFFLLPEWAERWDELLMRFPGMDTELTRHMMRDSNSSLVYVDTGVRPIPHTALHDCSTFFDLPYSVEKVTLDHLLEVIRNGLERLSAGGKPQAAEGQQEEPPAESRGATAVAMLDLISSVLEQPDNLQATTDLLAQKVRELTGARAVILTVSDEKYGGHRILAVNPPRHAALTGNSSVQELIEKAFRVEESTVLLPEIDGENEGSLPASTKLRPCLLIPLGSGANRIGAILSLGLLDPSYVESIREIQGVLSRVVSVVLRGALLVDKQQAVAQELAREIDERRQTEIALRESEAVFNSFMEHSPIYVFFKDEHARVLRLSRNFEKMLGRPIEGLQGKDMVDLFPADFAKKIVEDDKRLLERNEAVTLDEEFNGRHFTTMKFPIRVEGHPPYLAGFTIDITDRKEADDQLRRTRDYLDSLITYANAPIITWDPDFTITRFNRAFERLSGWRAEEVLGKKLGLLFPSENKNTSVSKIRKALQGEFWESVEIPIQRTDGTIRTVLWNSANILDADGKTVVSTIAQGQDITDRKNVENALRESEEQVRLLLNSTAEAIYGIDLGGDCTFANPACCRLIGFSSPADLIGKNMHSLIHHSHADGTPMPVETCRIYQAFREGREVHVDDEVLWRRDGTCFRAEYWSYPQIANMKIVGAVVTFNDITERVEAEKTIRESQEKFQGLVETMYDCVWEVDTQGHYTYVSPRIQAILGYQPHELLGLTPFDVMTPDDARRVGEIAAALMAKQKPIVALENMNLHRDGHRVILETNARPFYSPDGTYLGYRGTDRDITRRRQAEELLAMERERLANILEGTNVGTWEWNVQTGETVFNERWAEMLGYSLEELAPLSIETWTRLTHPTDLEAAGETLRRHFRKETSFYQAENRMHHKNGNWIWVLDRGKVATWTPDGKPLMMFGTHQDITDRKTAEEQIRHMATHDPLTDLPNLRLAQDRLGMALKFSRRDGTWTALMFIDLDGFKVVNDEFGHDVGDFVLKRVAERLRACLRDTDTVARVGGDEFLLVATNLRSTNSIEVIAKKIIRLVSQPIQVAERVAHVGASVGIALYPGDGEDIEQLIKRADEAMYEVKSSGKNGFRFASPR